MLTHVRELIAQNAEKMRLHWPNAPMGIYSAGLGKRNLGEPITFAGIQSVRTKAESVIVDWATGLSITACRPWKYSSFKRSSMA